MRQKAVVACVVMLLASVAASAAEPWAKTVPFESFKTFGRVVIPNSEKPVARTLDFPAVEKKADSVLVLRFRARIQGPRFGGWNYYLGINLNDKQLDGDTANATPRVVNRSPQMDVVIKQQPRSWSLWGRNPPCGTSLNVFFAHVWNAMDERLRSDREELYWYVVDISDLVNYRVIGYDNQDWSAKPNTLTLTNNLLFRFVKNKKHDIVLEDFAVGCIPKHNWRKKVENYTAKVLPLTKPFTLRGEGFNLKVGAKGAFHIVKDEEVFAVESLFSSPGERIHFNALSEEPGANQHPEWRVAVSRSGPEQALITAACPQYSLTRTVRIVGDKVKVFDTIKNTDAQPVGILIRHSVTAPESFKDCRLAGVPELSIGNAPANPTIFVNTGKAAVGVLAEDNVLRLQFSAASRPNRAFFKASRFGLGPGKERTCEWTLYPMDKKADYWAFVNRVRKDWRIAYTIQGPFGWFHVQRKRQILSDPGRLRRYLERKRLKIVVLAPWPDHSNMDDDTGDAITREKYKTIMQDAIRRFKEVDPGILCIGALEAACAMTFSMQDAAKLHKEMPGKRGYHRIPMSLLKEMRLRDPNFADCLFIDNKGQPLVGLYIQGVRGKPPWIKRAWLPAYSAPGNAQRENMLEQERFLMEEVGMDGVYMDCFSHAWGAPIFRYSSDRWDGLTVNIAPETGRIEDKYLDAGFVGTEVRAEYIRKVLDKNGVVVCNSFAAVRETQALPTYRFAEAEWFFNPLALQRGEDPRLLRQLTAGHLSSSIGLGHRPVRLGQAGMDNYARVITKSVITLLRNGMLYYHYGTEIPETGPGAGEYGPINHMFPITPIELGPGFVVGKERIVTAISRSFAWPNAKRPEVLVFDVTGRPTKGEVQIRRMKGAWSVDLTIEDWENVAVIR